LKKPAKYNPSLLAILQTLQGGDFDDALTGAIAWGANIDALFQGGGGSLPSTVILDYVYGVAAYTSWYGKRGDVSIVMNAYREKYYAQIPPLPRVPPDDTVCDESDLAKAMDELNFVLMYLYGITPKKAAERRQKEIEEERAAQEASRSTSDRVEEAYGRLLKCIHHYCLSFLQAVSTV
jgi:hypothetical protein